MSAVPPTEQYATYALASDTASLDPEHQINASFRDQGIGLVPRVRAMDVAGLIHRDLVFPATSD